MAAHALVLQHGYRHLGPESHLGVERLLSLAADALHMALLTIDGSVDEDSAAKHSRVASARHFLVEAVTALARARVHVPGIRTFAVNIVTTSESGIDRELARLRELASQLLWRNHTVLPARLQDQPLAPEDEAQLAAVVRQIGVRARVERLMRHKWLVATAVLGALAPVVGVGVLVFALASGAVAAVELVRTVGAPVDLTPLHS